MKVERRVDTVIVEMDERTAHKVQALLMRAFDNTFHPGDLTELAARLAVNADIGGSRHNPTEINGQFVEIKDFVRTDS